MSPNECTSSSRSLRKSTQTKEQKKDVWEDFRLTKVKLQQVGTDYYDTKTLDYTICNTPNKLG